MQEAVIVNMERNLGRGSATAFIGTTEAGKTTGIAGMAKGDTTSNLLLARISSGKGSVANAEICVTNDVEIDPNILYVSGSISRKTVAEITDDNKFLGKTLFSATKEVFKLETSDKAKRFEEKLEKTLDILLKQPSNETLEYKLSSFSKQDKAQILWCLKQFPIEELTRLYEEVITLQKLQNKKGLYASNLFSRKLGEKSELTSCINQFWETIAQGINGHIENFQKLLNRYPDICHIKIDEKESGKYHFYVMLSGKIEEEELADTFLKSENGSKEYLFSKLCFVFRGADFVFENVNTEEDTFAVCEHNGNTIRVLRFIDTMGLFHQEGKDAAEETERIFDMLAEFHCEKVIFVISADVNATVKNGYQALRNFLLQAKVSIQVYLLFTKWDMLVQSQATSSAGVQRFGRTVSEVNWEEKFSEAVYRNRKVVNFLEESLQENTNRNKPTLIGVFDSGLVTGNVSLDTCLEEHGVCYISAMSNLIKTIAHEEKKTGNKIRIQTNQSLLKEIVLPKDSPANVSKLYKSLVEECQGKKLYASTVSAAIRKWRCLGEAHTSAVNPNPYGYENIVTEFVWFIGNYGRELCRNAVDLNQEVVVGAGRESYVADATQYIHNNAGKIFAQKVADVCYQSGFLLMNNDYKPQYQRFAQMLQYLHGNFFYSEQVVVNQQITSCLQDAVEEALNQYVNSNCIMIF